MQKIYSIDGMHCNSCVTLNTDTLKNLDGVEAVEIDLPTKQATIDFDPEKINEQAIMDQVRQNGFQIRDINEKPGFFTKLFKK